jgi:hypothetical protein
MTEVTYYVALPFVATDDGGWPKPTTKRIRRLTPMHSRRRRW